MKAIKDITKVSNEQLADLILLYRIDRFRCGGGARRSTICNGYPPQRYQSCRESLERLVREGFVREEKDGARTMVKTTGRGKQRLRWAPLWPVLLKERKVRAMAAAATRGESA